MNIICIKCDLEFTKTGSRNQCKNCISNYNKTYYMDHREDLIPKSSIRSSQWCRNNKERRNKLDRQRRLAGKSSGPTASARYRQRLRDAALQAYGSVCDCCGESIKEFLAFDHINGNGTKHRKEVGLGGGSMELWMKKNNYPPMFRILCLNCNYSAYLDHGICFHKREGN